MDDDRKINRARGVGSTEIKKIDDKNKKEMERER
jgi:hypothetical protein